MPALSKIKLSQIAMPLLLMGVLFYMTGMVVNNNIYPVVALGLVVLSVVMVRISINQVVDLIFWSSFIVMFIGHRFIQTHIFSIDNTGIKHMLFWLIDYMIIILIMRLLMNLKYQQKVLRFSIWLAGFLLISFLVNSIPFSRILLAFRSEYFSLFYIFAFYIYEFSDSRYEKYLKLFLKLAIISSLLSLLSFICYGPYETGDINGGIFGLKGTGIGVFFAVVQAVLFLQIFMRTNQRKYLGYSLICALFIITGKAYFGFPLAISCIVIILLFNFKLKLAVRNILVVSLVATIIGTVNFMLLPEREANDAIKRFTDKTEIINYDYSQGRQMGRIGSMVFLANEIQRSTLKMFLGYGAGAISYQGNVSKFENEFFAEHNLSAITPALGFAYEFGLVGIAILFGILFYFFRMWRQLKLTPSKIEDYYLLNMPALLFAFFACLFYTDVIDNYFLMIFIGFQISYLRKRYKAQMLAQKNPDMAAIR